MQNEIKLSKKILKVLNNCEDIKCRVINVAGLLANIIFAQDITEYVIINEHIIKPLQEAINIEKGNVLSYISQNIINGREVLIKQNVEDVAEEILKGKVALVVEGQDKILLIDAANFVFRSVTEPPTSSVMQGPREGFTESIKNNLNLLRRRLSTPDFININLKIGRKTKTAVSLLYIDKVADKKIVDQVYKKLKSIDIDGVLDSNYIAQFLHLYPNSIFKQVGASEKPDIVVSKMLEGRVAIVVDGSPLVLTLPFVIFENFQSSEDYYTNHHHATFVRWIRLIGVMFSILLPGVFVAIQLYHYSIIPLNFMVTIANTTQGIPFTPVIEMLFIVLLFELLNEASLRMPKYFGMAMSIVGALILGETAVSAGLISPPTVMIVALSSLTSFAIADLYNQISLMRLAFILMGAVFGLFGIMLGLVWLISYMSSLDSYGTPFLAPMAPFVKRDMQDFLHVASRLDMKKNPASIPNNNKFRLKGYNYGGFVNFNFKNLFKNKIIKNNIKYHTKEVGRKSKNVVINTNYNFIRD